VPLLLLLLLLLDFRFGFGLLPLFLCGLRASGTADR
jgi:hypothetical protein